MNFDDDLLSKISRPRPGICAVCGIFAPEGTMLCANCMLRVPGTASHSADAFAFVARMDAKAQNEFMRKMADDMAEMMRAASAFEKWTWHETPEAARRYEREQRRGASDQFNREHSRAQTQQEHKAAEAKAEAEASRHRSAAEAAAQAAARKHVEEMRKAAESFKRAGSAQSKTEWMRDREEEVRYGFGGRQGAKSRQQERAAPAPPPPQTSSSVDLDMSMLRRLIQLCHPDKHNGSEGAQIATRFLLGIKSRLEGGR